jgi:hypothetical protein
MDPRRLNASTQLASGPTDAGAAGFGTLEVWNIKAGGTGWSHPVHVHFEEGIILSRGGKAPPEWEKWAQGRVPHRLGKGWLDSVEMAINFREFAGPTWSTVTTPSMRTTRCCCVGTLRSPGNSS